MCAFARFYTNYICIKAYPGSRTWTLKHLWPHVVFWYMLPFARFYTKTFVPSLIFLQYRILLMSNKASSSVKFPKHISLSIPFCFVKLVKSKLPLERFKALILRIKQTNCRWLIILTHCYSYQCSRKKNKRWL